MRTLFQTVLCSFRGSSEDLRSSLGNDFWEGLQLLLSVSSMHRLAEFLICFFYDTFLCNPNVAAPAFLSWSVDFCWIPRAIWMLYLAASLQGPLLFSRTASLCFFPSNSHRWFWGLLLSKIPVCHSSQDPKPSCTEKAFGLSFNTLFLL